MKMIAIGGEPASGKTTLMLGLIQRLSKPSVIKWGKLVAQEHPREQLVIFGDYRIQDTFSGTDKLSMAVQPEAIEFVRYAAQSKLFQRKTLLFEGDRLFTGTFLKACQAIPGVELRTIVLRADPELLQRRHAERNDTQTSTFLKSRRTKIQNIIDTFPETEIWLSSLEDALVYRLESYLNRP